MAEAVRQRRRARHILDNYYCGPADDPDELEIWGYTDRFTYRPGDVVDLRVSTTASTWDVEVGRDGAEYEAVFAEHGRPGEHHPVAADVYASGCDWPVGVSFTIADDWRPGGYLVTLTGRRGDEVVEEHHIVFVRSSVEQCPDLALLVTTGTWVAYNDWGGANAYEGIAGPGGDGFSPRLSLRRPWTRGFCRLPAGAPRTVDDAPPTPGEMTRYPYMEWAFAYGYSKKYASAGWATYERPFARWADAEGFAFDVLTQHDLDADPTVLDGYRCVVVVGHDEYWTGPQRDVVDAWVDDGGRLARFAGDFLWKVRMEDEGRTQVAYKHLARRHDPERDATGGAGITGPWEAPEVGRPGVSTVGANGLAGIYAGLGRCVGQGPNGFTIYRPDHWAFADAGLGYGDVLGARSRIFGYEVDGLDLVIRDGLPEPTGADGASTDIEILGVGLAVSAESDTGVWGETLYIETSSHDFKAYALHGEVTSEALEQTQRGNGVIVSWRRGEGEIFCAATCEWVAGLLRHDHQVEQVTRNVLRRFLGR